MHYRLLILFLAAALLSGCPIGNGDDDATDDDDEAADDDDATDDDDDATDDDDDDDDDDEATDDDDSAVETEFTCSTTLNCTIGVDYCLIEYPGVPGPIAYSCVAIPTACQPDPDCACITAFDCVEDPEDAITVSVYFP